MKGESFTLPGGFVAGAVHAGLKKEGMLDLGILFCENPCVAAGVFTQNRIKAAPVILSRERLRKVRPRALVVNSGCANACTGERGFKDAVRMSEFVAEKLAISPEEVLVASTGVIGQYLPMEKIRSGIGRITLSKEGGGAFALSLIHI